MNTDLKASFEDAIVAAGGIVTSSSNAITNFTKRT